jgi:hypothetical protein
MVTCFIPGLPAGEPFRISIHSWRNPEASRYIHQISSKHVEYAVFEARVYVDGRLAGYVDGFLSADGLRLMSAPAQSYSIATGLGLLSSKQASVTLTFPADSRPGQRTGELTCGRS